MSSTVLDNRSEKGIISLYDTTLRDGEQSPSCTMYTSEKIAIAKELENFGVDVIEAGFAASSKQNFDTIKKISEMVHRPYVCSMARCVEEDIVSAYDCLKNYNKRMIHIFVSTSKIHMEKKLRKTEKEVVEMAREAARRAKDYFPQVEFSAEDGTRSENSFLEEIFGTVLNEGVNVINLADTVGYSLPEEFGGWVKYFSKYVRKINTEAIVSVHCHNDLGLAIANSLEGIKNGATRVEGTINGIGERAGNCALEAIVATALIHPKMFRTNAKIEYTQQVSRAIKNATGAKNDFAPITGTHAFSCKSGIHQHGMAKEKSTYEIFSPKSFGMSGVIEIGPHSGAEGVITKARELGFEIDRELAKKVLSIVDEKVEKEIQKRFSDEDIENILLKMTTRKI